MKLTSYKAVISKQKIAMDNQAALDHLKTRSAEGKIPQKCVYKKKLTLGSDPMQQLATDALNQSRRALRPPSGPRRRCRPDAQR